MTSDRVTKQQVGAGTGRSWPQWTVPDEAYDRALNSAPHRITEDMSWDDDLTTALNAAIPIIRAATLRQAAERLRQSWTVAGDDKDAIDRMLNNNPDDEADRLLDRWADEVSSL